MYRAKVRRTREKMMNLDVPPSLLYTGRWHVREDDHCRAQPIAWNSNWLVAYRTPLLRSGLIGIYGGDILAEIKNKYPQLPVLNANALDFLLAHPRLIPNRCKPYWLYFVGTIYTDRYSDHFIRYLIWDANAAEWKHCDTLVEGYGWGSHCAIATYMGLTIVR